MEDVLEVYAEPYDPRRPKVNVDETNKPDNHIEGSSSERYSRVVYAR
jgi:hypothetical protein